MRPPSQYQARRLLELVSDNKARTVEKDHIDQDVWARTHPPVRGLNFRDRESARYCLRAGGLGAVPTTPTELPDARSRAPPLAKSNHHLHQHHQSMPRVESNQSKLTVSSVPSFGKMREPLSGDSVNLHAKSTRPALKTEYEEFGSEALITQVQDEIDEEFDDSTPSRLFSEIGPSISVAKGIDGKKLKRTPQLTLQHLDIGVTDQPIEQIPYNGEDDQFDAKSISSAPKSLTSATKTISSMPSTAITPPPHAPDPSYALESEFGIENKMLLTDTTSNSSSAPPPPPLPHTIEKYESTSTIPPPPSSPPPKGDEKRTRRNTDDSSPVTEGDSYSYKKEGAEELSDAADSSVRSMKDNWYGDYSSTQNMSEKDGKLNGRNEGADEDSDSFGAVEVESVDDEEYEQDMEVRVDDNFVGRRREGLVG